MSFSVAVRAASPFAEVTVTPVLPSTVAVVSASRPIALAALTETFSAAANDVLLCRSQAQRIAEVTVTPVLPSTVAVVSASRPLLWRQ